EMLEPIGDCTDVESGIDAIVAFNTAIDQKSPFDLITLDINMPEMDGMETLVKIRENEAQRHITKQDRVKIIMVTAYSDRDNIMVCLKAGCDDFIVKPFDLETVTEKLKRLGMVDTDAPKCEKKVSPPPPPASPGLSSENGCATAFQEPDIINEVSQALQSGMITLPPLPDINQQLKTLIRKGADVKEVAKLLKKDMVISSILISISNSPFFRGVEKNNTLKEAVNRLGIHATYHQVAILCHRAPYNDIAERYTDVVSQLWNHVLSCAFAAKTIAESCGKAFSEDPFTMGLVHDIGKLFLLQIISELEDRGEFGGYLSKGSLNATIESFHGQFGGRLLRKWAFSETYVEIAREHDHLDNVQHFSKELTLISLANLLVKNIDIDSDESFKDMYSTLFIMARVLGIEVSTFIQIRDHVRRIISKNPFRNLINIED
ncbi:MAG: HDOD domain-containing protein, partial [Desulfobacterales bacterium]|nr:HDOD domain-containing protein [Desulfobacterales bacterium]